MKGTSYYFSHDYNTRQDIKIKKLLVKHGMIGYGCFWSIIEDLYNNANALPLDYESIAYDLRVSEKVIESVINDFDLFVIEGIEFGSKSVEKRLEDRNEKSTKARQSALKRWGDKNDNANALQTESEPNAIKERKGNKSKVKEINIPTLKEFGEYAIEHKPNADKQDVKLKYEAWLQNDWKDGNNNKILNWKTKLLNTLPHIKENKEPIINKIPKRAL